MEAKTSNSTGSASSGGGGSATAQQPSTGGRPRGFAAMNAEKQREIARKGGKAAHEKGTAHEFTADEARAAGRKGGERVSANRAHMATIGRMGGKNSAARRSRGGGDKDDPDGSTEAGGSEGPGSAPAEGSNSPDSGNGRPGGD
jgi:general stress protein YciG